MELKTDQKTYRRTHSVYEQGERPPCGYTNALVIAPKYPAFNATVEEVGAGGDKDDKNLVKVSGTVQLPQPKK